MKHFILVVLTLLSVGFQPNLFGQSKNEFTRTCKYVYCELIGEPKFLSTQLSYSVDYGVEKIELFDSKIQDEQAGKVRTFKSMVDALNYMGYDGWEFVQAYIERISQTEIYHWILRKERE